MFLSRNRNSLGHCYTEIHSCNKKGQSKRSSPYFVIKKRKKEESINFVNEPENIVALNCLLFRRGRQIKK